MRLGAWQRMYFGGSRRLRLPDPAAHRDSSGSRGASVCTNPPASGCASILSRMTSASIRTSASARNPVPECGLAPCGNSLDGHHFLCRALGAHRLEEDMRVGLCDKAEHCGDTASVSSRNPSGKNRRNLRLHRSGPDREVIMEGGSAKLALVCR